MIVTGDGIFQIRIQVNISGQDNHDSEVFVAGRAKGPKSLYIRN
jgi:hypothetical protein